MIVHFYFNTTHTAEILGSVLRAVVCDRCQTRYYYIASRRGAGSRHADYGIDREFAEQIATATAQQELQYRLQTATEMVPCPRCQWISRCLQAPGQPDPNVTGSPPQLPPGTPPALIETSDPASGAHLLVPQPRGNTAPDTAGVILRAGQSLAPNCCVCLAPAQTTYRPVWNAGPKDRVAFPACHDCRRRLRRRWFVYSLVIIVAIATVGTLAIRAGFPGGVDQMGRIFLVVLCSALAAFAAIGLIPNALVRPGSAQTVDSRRDVVRVRFRNRDFAKLCQEALAAGDLQPIPMWAPPTPPAEPVAPSERWK